MHFALADPRVGTLIATDQRHSMYLTTGEAIRGDYGGKLLRLGRGWMVLAGDSLYAALAVERLQQIDAVNIPAVSNTLSALADEAPAIIAERWPGAPSNPDDQSNYLIATATRIAVVRWNGTVLHQGGGMAMAYPARYPATPASRQAAHHAMRARLSQALSAYAMIRMVAREFATVAEHAENVSPTIEIATGTVYLSGVASDLAAMKDDELQRALTTPPLPTPTAFTRILTEHVTI